MIEIHFETLRFGSLNFPRLPPPRKLLPRVHDLSMGVLPQISGCESLQLFRLQKFQNFPPALSPRVILPEVDDPSMCVFWNQRLICTLAFRPSGFFDPTQPVTSFPTGVPSLQTTQSIAMWRNTRSEHVAQSGGCHMSRSN
jgi:hypothetical protein